MPFIPDDRVCLLLLRKAEEVEETETETETTTTTEGDADQGAGGDGGGGGEGEVWFYLDIPLDDINPLCLRPRKYLLYLGWCILGLDRATGESLVFVPFGLV
jgi:hypothetical protein